MEITALFCQKISTLSEVEEQSYRDTEKLIVKIKHYFALSCLKSVLEVNFICSIGEI